MHSGYLPALKRSFVDWWQEIVKGCNRLLCKNKIVPLHSQSERDWLSGWLTRKRRRNFFKEKFGKLKSLRTFALPNRKRPLAHHKLTSTSTKNFILIENKICRLKNFPYLCTPNHKQDLQTARKRAAQLAHTVTLIECGTRSLNDGNRQNSKCLASFG
jgi:hypothetical protein